MERARPQTFHLGRDSDAKKDVEGSRTNALEQFIRLDLRVSSELEKQFVTSYLPRIFHTTMPWCVGDLTSTSKNAYDEEPTASRHTYR